MVALIVATSALTAVPAAFAHSSESNDPSYTAAAAAMGLPESPMGKPSTAGNALGIPHSGDEDQDDALREEDLPAAGDAEGNEQQGNEEESNEQKSNEQETPPTFTPEDARASEAAPPSDPGEKANEDIAVNAATFDWGVRTSFRNYLTGNIAKGSVTLLGSSVSGSTTPPFPQGFAWEWSGGSGKVNVGGQGADVAFTGGSGLHFLGHEMTGGHALDLRFTNPRITVESATSGKLYFDVKSRKFDGMTSISKEFFEQKSVHLANLTLGAVEHDATAETFTWTNAGAKLTKIGAEAFGGFYAEGEELDPVSFTLPYDFDGEIVVPGKTSTKTTLSASATEVQQGTSITLTAKIDPAVDGTVRFLQGDNDLGSKEAADGSASLDLTDLPVGIYGVQAVFMPSDNENYAHSFSNTLELVVNEQKKKDEEVVPPSQAKSAGSLTWGISNYFVGYTTQKSNTPACPTPSRHCAGGSISTNGVGAGWMFPQASADWSDETQTGTINFAGSVVFSGYGTTMFQVASPSITVHNATSATLHTGYSGSYGPSTVELNLGAASKTVGAGGEVTWRNVAVMGGLNGISAGQSMNFDSLSFTVGSTSGISFGSTTAGSDSKAKRTPAAVPPATSGITVLTDPTKLRPGGRIEMEASGFDPNDEGVLVVLYSDPIVLDAAATADDDGTVRWSGTLPEDIAEGEHVITLQGSVDAGAVIQILPKKENKAAAAKKQVTKQQLTTDQFAAAGVLGGGSGMTLWEWWASAAGLALIAACTTALSMRQRRSL